MVDFSIEFLGVGSALSKKNYNTNAVIEVNGKNYLMDCGITAPTAMHELGITTGDIDGVIISHIHGDHAGGLETIGYEGMFIYGKKPELYIASELVEDIWNKHLAGGMEHLTRKLATLNDYFDVKPFHHGTLFNINGLEVKSIKTHHVPSDDEFTEKASYSFLLDNRVFWSADMLFDKDLIVNIEKAHNMKRYFHDCQLFYHPDGVHASLQELETLPEEIKNKVIVMHYGDNIKDFEDRILSNGFTIARQFDKFQF